MAGFMNPGLGFASSAGAFIGGAAGQANKNIEEQKVNDRQNDFMWGSRFERGLAEYNKDKKDSDMQARMYNNFLSLSKGNKQLADTAMNHVLVNPKGYEDAVQMLTKNANAPPDPNYQSPFMSDMQSNLATKHQHLQQMHDSLSPSYQQHTQMPDAPGSMQPQGQPQIQPAQAPPIASPGPPTQLTSGSPDQIMPSPGQQKPQAQAQPIPPSQGTPPQPAQNQGLYGPKPETQRQQEQTDLGNRHLQLQREQFEFQKQTKPASPQEKLDMELAQAAAKDYLDNPKYGLQSRHNQLQDYQSQMNDVNGMMQLLNNGLKASSVDPMLAELNRFTTATMGLDLSTVGISNSVRDTQTLKKLVADAMINRLKTLHFGRITNYTESIVKQGMPAMNNDPNTNIKIALAMKSVIDSAMKGTQLEHDVAFGSTGTGNPTGQSVGQARLAVQKYTNDYIEKNKNAPWAQFEVNKTNIPLLSHLERGTWFEDSSKAANGKMFRVMGPSQDGNFLQLQDADNNSYNIPMH